jgi:hypothetical protein
MGDETWLNKLLYRDSLDILPGQADASVDLVYLDRRSTPIVATT